MKTLYRLLIFFFVLFQQEHVTGQDQTLFNGRWKANSYFTTFEGAWDIIKNKDKILLVLADDFKAKKAPDLKIFLSKLELDAINGDNASDESTSVLVANLNQYKGKSTYEIPKEIDLSEYKTILVHCKKYSKFWGGSPLK